MSLATRQAAFALGVLRQRPFQCLVQVTNRCNMRCSFCDFWRHPLPPAQELSTADYVRIADELAGIGRFLVSIEGGEPLQRRDIVDIVTAFSRQHLVVLYTNGWHMDEALACRLFEAGLARIGVSVDYPDAARHDAARGLHGAHTRALDALSMLRRLAPGGRRQVHMMSVLMQDNAAELDALLRLSGLCDVGHCLTLLSTEGTRRGNGHALPATVDRAHLLDLWRRHPHLYLPRRYLTGMADFLAGQAAGACVAGAQSFNIDHAGEVSPCIERIGESFGNVRHEPLPDIWRRMRDRQPATGCNRCWTLCRGISQTLSRRGSMDAWLDLARRM